MNPIPTWRDEIERLRTAAMAGLDALRMPCDRWNKTQSMLVNDAISLLRAALEGALK